MIEGRVAERGWVKWLHLWRRIVAIKSFSFHSILFLFLFWRLRGCRILHPCFVSFHFLSFAIQLFNVGSAARLLAKWEVLQLPCNPSPGDMDGLESALLTWGVLLVVYLFREASQVVWILSSYYKWRQCPAGQSECFLSPNRLLREATLTNKGVVSGDLPPGLQCFFNFSVIYIFMLLGKTKTFH